MEELTKEQIEELWKEIHYRIKQGLYLQDYLFNLLKIENNKKLIKLYFKNLLKDNYVPNISFEQWSLLPNKIKIKYTRTRIEKHYNLSNWEYDFISTKLKKRYVNIKSRFSNNLLSDDQFNLLKKVDKLSYIKNRIDDRYHLTEYQFKYYLNLFPDELKIIQIKNLIPDYILKNIEIELKKTLNT